MPISIVYNNPDPAELCPRGPRRGRQPCVCAKIDLSDRQ